MFYQQMLLRILSMQYVSYPKSSGDVTQNSEYDTQTDSLRNVTQNLHTENMTSAKWC